MPPFLARRIVLPAAAAPAELWRGLAAYGSGEMAARAVRLLTTLVIARSLAPQTVGEAAIALTLFELVRVLARNGVGQAIIAAPAERVEATCNRAHRLFWYWAAILVAIQLAVALLVAVAFDMPRAAAMLAVLSLVYPLMPGGLVQVHLAMREGLSGRTARNAAAQTGLDHLLTATLLILYPSPWSLVLPKLLTAPLWLLLSRRSRPWTPDPAAGAAPIPGLRRMGMGVMGAEMLSALRTNGDNLLVAAILGTSSLGTYYFAYSAGLGIAASFVSAIANTVFPILCRAAPDERAAVMGRIGLVAGGLGVAGVVTQALAAPFYVPLLFGPTWAFAGPVVAIICLAGIAHLAQALLASWLRATDRAPLEAMCSSLACAGALGGLALGASQGTLIAAAIGLTAGQWLAAVLSFALFGPRLRRPAPSFPRFSAA